MKRRLLAFASVLVLAFSASALQTAAPAPQEDAAAAIADRPLAKFQLELLDVAFDAASAMPLEPHVKNRSRAQELVVETCFELEQPRRALEYIAKIDNWRRGAGYAAYALYCVEHGDTREVQRYLDLADRICHEEKTEDYQEWRVERIRAKMAQVYGALGSADKAAEYELGIKPAELGDLEVAKARGLDAAAFDAKVDSVDAIAAIGDFDQVRNVLQACALLFDRFYDDAERRVRVETKIKGSWKKLPSPIRLELMASMIDSALGHRDRKKALELAEEAAALLRVARLSPDVRIPWSARLAGMRFKSGDEDGARRDAAAAMKDFDAERASIVNIERSDVLRPLAEVWQLIGDRSQALQAFTMALEAGVENPNSRPRAEDLSATCCAMARCAFEPDETLEARILEIASKLGDPW